VSRTHHYQVSVTWTGDRGSGTSGYRDYARDHDVTADGPPVLLGSSDPALRGDRTRWNPEQLLVASLSQCHMLWFLHLCAEAQVVVTGYTDAARGSMVEDAGGGHFVEVTLAPHVVVADAAMIDVARPLHETAHERCFIANSVNFPVGIEPTFAEGGR
jgi:organic hydroperoxide reductase OsmC/OhrA